MYKICPSCSSEMKGEVCEKCGYGEKTESRELNKIKAQAKKLKHPTVEVTLSCAECGGAIENNKCVDCGKLYKEPPKKTTKLQLLIVILVLAVGGVFYVLYQNGMFSARDEAETIQEYFSALCEGDYDKFLDTLPKEMAQENKDDRASTQLSKEAYMQAITEDIAEEFGEDFNIVPTVLNQSAMSAENVLVLNDSYFEFYGVNPSIKEAVDITVELEYSGSKAETVVDNAVITVAKIGGKWYMLFVE